MNQTPSEQCVAICGLFCGACPAYPKECHGCLSDYVREGCRECKNGFRDCVKMHNISRCYECTEFPCKRLEDFSRAPVINGICNHANVIPDSYRLREVETAQWISEQLARHTCRECGELISWFDMGTHKCK